MFFSWIHIWIHDFSWIHIWIHIWILSQDPPWYTRIRSFSWIHARYHGFWPLFMGEILWEIMSDEYREEYREEYGEMMEDFYEFILEPHWIHGAVRRRAVSDGARPFCRCCSRATCLTVSLSIPATSVQVHVRVGALPIVLSESRNMTSVPSQ